MSTVVYVVLSENKTSGLSSLIIAGQIKSNLRLHSK